ncbi:unannotated protein [freshwater metagenome]|uniref:Unannotated protein n=1 Tax=freshwater metagenome TaxID=449393 RepID=A0A6J6CYU1_9ZZZZ
MIVTRNTDPSWLPLMLEASALVTEHGGRTSHAAILSRELGLLCVVGCADATTKLLDVQRVRVACEHGLGTITRADDSPTYTRRATLRTAGSRAFSTDWVRGEEDE